MAGGLTFIVVLGFVAGVSIGCIGVGGVIVVPGLVYVGGWQIQTAISAAMMGYLLTGAIGTAIYAGKKSINWSMAIWLCVGAMPAALAGAWASNNMPTELLETGIGLLTLASGLNTAFNKQPDTQGDRNLGKSKLVAIGGLTGVLSAITGTGGPLVLVPVMLWLNVPVLTAIGLSQAVQVPIAALATTGNFLYGDPDMLLGLLLGGGLAAGSFAGAHLAHHVPVDRLKFLVSCVLVLVGLAIIGKNLLRLLGV